MSQLLGMALLATLSIATCGGCSDSKKPAEAGMPKPGFDVESPVPGSPGGKRISETEDRIVRFEKRRESIQRLLDKALADKDDLVSKLRESGVVKSSDLKGKPEAQRYATSLTKLTREIDGLRGELARIDDTIQQAKSLVRRLQREEAGITEEEFAKLSEEFRAAEERTGDGASPVPDPIGIEAVLDRELKGSKAGSTPSAKGSERLVGKWEIVKGTRTVRSGAVEFTKGGTALLSWESVIRNALGDSQRRATLKYTLTGNTLRLEEPGNSDYRQKCEIQVEVISDGEMIFVNQKNSLSFDWLDGRLKRVK